MIDKALGRSFIVYTTTWPDDWALTGMDLLATVFTWSWSMNRRFRLPSAKTDNKLIHSFQFSTLCLTNRINAQEMLELWLKTQDLKHHTCSWLHRSLLYLSLKRLSVNHDAYSVNAGTKGVGLTSKCDLSWEEGGRAGETSRKKETAGRRKEEWEGGLEEEGFGPQVIGLLSFLDRPLSLLVKNTLLFSEEYSLQDFFFLFSQSGAQMVVSTLRALNKKQKKTTNLSSSLLFHVRYLSGGCCSPQVRAWAGLSHNSICMCLCQWVCVCVSYHLQVNLQITGHVLYVCRI